MTELPSFSVAGEVALVTGASSGIGLHLAEVLALAGAKVALAARRSERLERACEAIRERGGTCLPVVCDITSQTSIAAALGAVETTFGRLSVLVNNAGVVVSKPFFEHTEEDWDHVVDTNLKGAWLMAREFAHHLVGKKRGGRIVNIASVLSFRTIARVPSYLAAKAGLLHLNGAMAMELARYDILVNAIAPGYVVTDFNRDFLESEAGLKLAARVPMKRVGQVADLGGALLFLCSPASAYITGACISVDGGHGVAAI
ncbi:MAG TPA: SDR family oxidoreductase [Stellaceae bacterium]|nr:SDR family oxidoreductase [Stellaceae bacterium]